MLHGAGRLSCGMLCARNWDRSLVAPSVDAARGLLIQCAMTWANVSVSEQVSR